MMEILNKSRTLLRCGGISIFTCKSIFENVLSPHLGLTSNQSSVRKAILSIGTTPIKTLGGQMYLLDYSNYFVQIDDYLFRVRTIIDEEYGFCTFYLQKKTINPLVTGLQEVLITNHSKTILDRGFSEMMKSTKPKKVDALKLLY